MAVPPSSLLDLLLSRGFTYVRLDIDNGQDVLEWNHEFVPACNREEIAWRWAGRSSPARGLYCGGRGGTQKRNLRNILS